MQPSPPVGVAVAVGVGVLICVGVFVGVSVDVAVGVGPLGQRCAGKGWGAAGIGAGAADPSRTIGEIAKDFGTDAVRYFILSNLPENKESSFIACSIQRLIYIAYKPARKQAGKGVRSPSGYGLVHNTGARTRCR